MSELAQRQLQRITNLLRLERRVRHAITAEELGFVMVNETHGLLPYRQAALWRDDGSRIAAVSGLALPDHHAPYIVWLHRLFRHLGEGTETRALGASDLPEDLAREWTDWLGVHALWVPLSDPLGQGPETRRLGALLLVRDEPWGDHDRPLLDYLADAYGHAWGRLAAARRNPWRRLLARRRLVWGVVLLALAAASWLPVRLSVLAPAEVIPSVPVMVRAPFDGVVDRVEVRPNDPVHEGQVLMTLDPSRLKSRFEVATKALDVAEAELRQASQQAVFDNKSKAQLPILQGKRDQHATEMAYVASLLERIEIKAPRNGIAIFDDVNDWIGKPVSIGERILVVADPREVELEIRLPVHDAIALDEGAETALFLNIDPHRPVAAHLTFSSYKASVTPDGVLAYRLKAAFQASDSALRVGLKGVAKLYGREVTLFYFLFRRPLAAARQWLRL